MREIAERFQMKPGMFGQNDPSWSKGDAGELKSKGPKPAPVQIERKRRRLAEPVYEPAVGLIRQWSQQSWFWPVIVTIIVITVVACGVNHISAMAALGLS